MIDYRTVTCDGMMLYPLKSFPYDIFRYAFAKNHSRYTFRWNRLDIDWKPVLYLFRIRAI